MDKVTIGFSIITSLIASIVFWLASYFIPSRMKILQVRPRVEEDIKSILLHIMFYIEIPFLRSVHTATDYQSDIDAQRINLSDYENALYGKCLSKERCVNEFEHRLLPVGTRLKRSTNELDKKLDKISRYTDFLSTKELLLLKEIGEKIHTYDYEEHFNEIDGAVFASVNPSISYMSRNFYELYLLYHELRKISDRYWFVKRNDYEKYRIVCQKLDKKRYFSFWISRISLNTKIQLLLDIRRYYLGANRRKLEKKLRHYLDLDKQKLIAQRLFLEYLLSDDDYQNLLIDIRGYEEMQEYLERVMYENVERKRFELRNSETKTIVVDKEKHVPKITDLSEEELLKVRKLFDGYM